jgi:arginase
VNTVIGVPYHLDEYLPGLDVPLRAGHTVTAEFTSDDVWDRLAVLYGAVADAVAGAASRGERPVVLSGDCTTALGTVAGLQRAGSVAGIVWFDAHGDVQTLETTTSGYIGGLPLRMLVGYRPELVAARLGLRPVPERQVLLVGARDLDPPEVSYLERAQIRRAEVGGLGRAALPDGPLYLHIDLDVIDSAEVPGLRFPAPGGPGPGPVAEAVERLLGSGQITAVGVACTWRPGHHAAARIGPHFEAALAAASSGLPA